MTPTTSRAIKSATVFFVFDDLTRDDCPYLRSSMAAARKKARQLNERGFPAVITDQNERTLETWMI